MSSNTPPPSSFSSPSEPRVKRRRYWTDNDGDALPSILGTSSDSPLSSPQTTACEDRSVIDDYVSSGRNGIWTSPAARNPEVRHKNCTPGEDEATRNLTLHPKQLGDKNSTKPAPNLSLPTLFPPVETAQTASEFLTSMFTSLHHIEPAWQALQDSQRNKEEEATTRAKEEQTRQVSELQAELKRHQDTIKGFEKELKQKEQEKKVAEEEREAAKGQAEKYQVQLDSVSQAVITQKRKVTGLEKAKADLVSKVHDNERQHQREKMAFKERIAMLEEGERKAKEQEKKLGLEIEKWRDQVIRLGGELGRANSKLAVEVRRLGDTTHAK